MKEKLQRLKDDEVGLLRKRETNEQLQQTADEVSYSFNCERKYCEELGGKEGWTNIISKMLNCTHAFVIEHKTHCNTLVEWYTHFRAVCRSMQRQRER